MKGKSMKKDELLKNIEKYWTNRAEGYSQVNLEELAGEKWPVWLSVIEEHMPKVERKRIRILDIGTGPGFFSIILSRAGYQVTAIDYTEEMLKKAKNNAGILADKIEWYQMDAQALRFADNTFDMIVSRNVTWNLEHPDRAYYEWMRVLKPSGVLLNFDANWYHHLFDEEKRAAYEAVAIRSAVLECMMTIRVRTLKQWRQLHVRCRLVTFSVRNGIVRFLNN